jgi:hypothetical protein
MTVFSFRRVVLCAALFFQVLSTKAQNPAYAHYCIDSLSSPSFFGRAYVKNGDLKAANFIRNELKKTAAVAYGDSWFQKFVLNTNSFPYPIKLEAGKTKLLPGRDFYMGGASGPIKGNYKAFWIDNAVLESPGRYEALLKNKKSKTVYIVDTGLAQNNYQKLPPAAGYLFTEKGKPEYDFASSGSTLPYAYANVSREKLEAKNTTIYWNAVNYYKKNDTTQNVIATIPGKKYTDSCIVFTAHYDHLGVMGDSVYFPGAHDNASGTAMLLDLAHYYSADSNRPDYTVVFMFFSGEEMGLLGSSYYVDHPLFPLSKIKFVLNLDMMSTGSDGIKVVNGSIFKTEFNNLQKINEENHLLKQVSPRGEAHNSDFYPFYKRGVRCFGLYTLGNEWKEYHSPADVSKGLPLTAYSEVFKLITLYVRQIK